MKPSNKKKYPNEWRFISLDIRMNRAKFRCEECGIADGAIVYKNSRKKIHELNFNGLEYLQKYTDDNNITFKQTLKLHKLTQIFLTVAHLDRDTKNNDYSNLKALCPKCHFNYDKRDNLKKRAQRLRFKHFTDGSTEIDFG